MNNVLELPKVIIKPHKGIIKSHKGIQPMHKGIIKLHIIHLILRAHDHKGHHKTAQGHHIIAQSLYYYLL